MLSEAPPRNLYCCACSILWPLTKLASKRSGQGPKSIWPLIKGHLTTLRWRYLAKNRHALFLPNSEWVQKIGKGCFSVLFFFRHFYVSCHIMSDPSESSFERNLRFSPSGPPFVFGTPRHNGSFLECSPGFVPFFSPTNSESSLRRSPRLAFDKKGFPQPYTTAINDFSSPPQVKHFLSKLDPVAEASCTSSQSSRPFISPSTRKTLSKTPSGKFSPPGIPNFLASISSMPGSKAQNSERYADSNYSFQWSINL